MRCGSSSEWALLSDSPATASFYLSVPTCSTSLCDSEQQDDFDRQRGPKTWDEPTPSVPLDETRGTF